MPIKDFDVVSSVGGRNYFVVKDLTPKPYPLVGGNHEYTYNLKPNTTYTISTTGTKGSTFRVNRIRVSYSITGDKGYRVTTDSSGVLRIGLYARNGETDQFIDGSARLKLEEGNIATDWTPAPEDITFDLRNKSIYVGSQKIESAYLGDKELYNTSPVDLTRHVGDPEYVIDFTGGTIDYIGKEGYSLDAFMTAPKGEPELTDEGLYFYERRILQSAERHSPTSGVFEVTVSVDEGKFGGSLETIMAIGDDYYSNRKRAIGYQRNSISFFDSYSSTRIQSEKIEGNEITIVFEWDINSSSNNVLFVNGERIGGINLSRVSNIDSTLFIGTSNNNDEGTFILKNIKHYSTANKLTDEQVMESYLLQKN